MMSADLDICTVFYIKTSPQCLSKAVQSTITAFYHCLCTIIKTRLILSQHYTHTHTLSHTHSLTHTHTHTHTHTLTHTLSHTHTHTHTHTHSHTHTLSHTHTHTRLFFGLRGLSIGVMVFILNNLYILLPYTYPTPKLSPHRDCVHF